MGGLAMEIFPMNINQFMNELTQWFDFSVRMMSHHPVISSTVALVAFVFYYAVSAVKFTLGIISFGLAMITAFLLQMLIF
jgi:hypothetical protein